MAWLKVVGMIPAQEGHSWKSGGLLVEPLRDEDSNWADGTRRAVWPLRAVLGGAGNHFVTPKGEDMSVPGADIGETALPPMVRVIIDLIDNEDRAWRAVGTGRIKASALGEWNVNAPLSGIVPTATNEGPNNWLQLTVLDLQAVIDQGKALNTASRKQIADNAQMTANLNAIAGAEPVANDVARPDPTTRVGKAIITMNNGAVYRSDGVTWGAPIGWVVLKSDVNAMDTRLRAVELGQGNGLVGYPTKAAMDADLNRAAGTVAIVTNDATATNNGEYLKVGAAGTGSWQVATQSRIALLEAGSAVNLGYDTHNRLVASRGVSAEYAAKHINNGNTVVIPVGGGSNPYPHPILRTAAGTTCGRLIQLSEVGLEVGQTVTVVLKAVSNSATARWGLHCRNAASSTVAGSPGQQPAFGTTGEVQATKTFTIPVGTTQIEIRAESLGASETLDIVRHGIFRGTVAFPLTEDRPSRAEYMLGSLTQTSGDARYIRRTDGSSAVNLAYDSHNWIASQVGILASRFLYTDGVSVVAPSTGANTAPWPALQLAANRGPLFKFSDMALKPGDQITVQVQAITSSATAQWAAHVRDANKAVANVSGSGQQAKFGVVGEATGSATFTIPANGAYLEVRAENLGASETLLLLTTAITKGSVVTPITPRSATGYEVYGLTSSVASNTARITTLEGTVAGFNIKRSPVLVTSGALTNPTLSLPSAPQSSSTSNQGFWGAVLQPGAITFNLVTFKPYQAIAGAGPGHIEVRQGTSATVLASADIPRATWNAAVTAGATLTVLLSAAVTVADGQQITVGNYATGETTGGMYAMNLGGIHVARAWTSSAANQTGALTSGSTSGGLWVNLGYDPNAMIEVYAEPKPGQVLDWAAIKSVAQNSLFGIPDILLPRKWYVLKRAGEQFNLYWKPLIRGEWYRFGVIDTTASYGRQYEKFYRLEAAGTEKGYNAPVGAFDLKVDVFDNDFALVKTATTNVNVVDTSNQNPVRYVSIGDSITHRIQYQPQVVNLGGVTTQGIRSKGGINYEGRGGWATSTYVSAGHATGTDSPFMFPADLGGSVYRGNTEFWRNARGVAEGTITATAYDFSDFALAAKEGSSAYAYDTSGYPLNPQNGWVVYDPTKANKWQTWNGSAWVDEATQSRAWAFDFSKYLTRYAWAFTAGNPTHVSIMLGTNDFQTTAGVNDWTGYNSRLTTMVNSIEATGAKVAIIIPPISASQDAWAQSGVMRDTEARFRRNMQDLARLILTNWDTAANEAAGVYVVQAGAMVNPEMGFTYAAPEKVDKYDSATVAYQADWVHPDLSGLEQLGDGIAGLVQATR